METMAELSSDVSEGLSNTGGDPDGSTVVYKHEGRIFVLKPSRINFVDTGVNVNIPPGHCLNITHHTNNRHFRLLNQYIYAHSNSKSLILPLVTHRTCQINYGDILGHIKTLSIDECYSKIVSEQEEIFYSSDDEDEDMME